jgi:hypothetical protein
VGSYLTEDFLASPERLSSIEFVCYIILALLLNEQAFVHNRNVLCGSHNVTTIQQNGHVEASGPLQTKELPEVDVTSTLTYAFAIVLSLE